MPNRLSHRTYTNNILRDAEITRNILKCYMYTENVIREYHNLLSLYRYISKSFEIYRRCDNIYCGLFQLLNSVLNLSNIHIYTVSILRGSCNIINNIERVQRAGCRLCFIRLIFFSGCKFFKKREFSSIVVRFF